VLKEERREVLDVGEAADLLGITEYTVRKFAREGKLPGRKIGREWRFTRRSLLDYIDDWSDIEER
jgi:excisionase family DNA binding protein